MLKVLKVLKVLRVLRVLVLMVLPAACGSPARPTDGAPPSLFVPDFAGIWVGEYRVTGCEGARHCYDATLGRTMPFVLRLRQDGRSVSGLFQSTQATAIDVSGSVSADGQMLLSGTMLPAGHDRPWTAELTQFSATVDPLTGLAGAFRYVVRPNPGSEGGQLNWAGEFVRASREPLPPKDAVGGTWRGQYLVQECTVTGSQYCQPSHRGELSGVELQLAQTGSDVSGTLTLGTVRVSVEGRVSGGRLTLQGSGRQTQGQRNSEMRLTDWAVNVDEIGRLNGSVSYTYESGFTSGLQSFTTVTRADLRNVVLAAGR